VSGAFWANAVLGLQWSQVKPGGQLMSSLASLQVLFDMEIEVMESREIEHHSSLARDVVRVSVDFIGTIVGKIVIGTAMVVLITTGIYVSRNPRSSIIEPKPVPISSIGSVGKPIYGTNTPSPTQETYLSDPRVTTATIEPQSLSRQDQYSCSDPVLTPEERAICGYHTYRVNGIVISGYPECKIQNHNGESFEKVNFSTKLTISFVDGVFDFWGVRNVNTSIRIRPNSYEMVFDSEQGEKTRYIEINESGFTQEIVENDSDCSIVFRYEIAE
jgi:hypothetical protein